MDQTPQRVLVVTPHPDDAEIWCGGTVARWVNEGAEVHYVLCTDGGKGTDKPGVTSQQLAATREQEQLDAARILGVDKRVGSLEIGKDGDVALYDGDPFEYTSHCVGVVIDGVVVSETAR